MQAKDLQDAEFMRHAVRSSLLSFARVIDPNFQAPAHIRLIAKKLEQVAKGEVRRLIINMAPRHGKSQLVSRIFPIWFLGNRPEAQMIISSYAASLATDLTRWQRNRAENEVFKDIFPNCILRDDSRAVERWETTAGGVVVGAGVGGPLTGRGADLAIIDDPVKNYEDAISPVIQETVWDWYASTFRTRLHPGGAIVIVHTRWTRNDLTGRLLEREPEKWEVLKLPAIESGVPLWPDRYDLAEIQDIRESVGEKIFSALYQQEPTDVIERIFQDPRLGDAGHGKMFAYLDPAFGGEDFSAIAIGARVGDEAHIHWVEMWQGEIDKTYAKVEALIKQWRVQCLYYESGVGEKRTDMLGHEFTRRGIASKARHHTTNKHLRIVQWLKGNWSRVIFSHACADTAFMRQVLDYTEQAKHDDAPDALSALVNELTRGGTGSILLSGRREFSGGPF